VSRVIAVVPAHNEEAQIAECLRSLLAQTRPPERVLVVLDNCTDNTELVVSGLPVEVKYTAGNVYKKAGTLNQALPGVALCTEGVYVPHQ
jgi:glycosyltransferase involved in cell wall biosynthesis